ncbi:hypothetical protein QBC38DRAFT_481037 [Podospora fimiseda]|uniref:Uncharacterized protein n=1 Tax=Podospora fimiseda TaxID=252190 RepID=A0AAN7BMY0_9PEZI|nr:hypothetical protein QBC38DRAFT_481037 [Podospora fimiseda]
MAETSSLVVPGAGASADTPSTVSTRPSAPVRKRSGSGAGGLLSKLPFMRSSGEHRPRSRRNTNEADPAAVSSSTTSKFPPTPSFTSIPAEPSAAAPSPRLAGTAVPQPQQFPQIYHQLPILQPQPLQPKTRRRRGSLRKVALLGRGAQRERRDRGLTIDTKLDVYGGVNGAPAVEITTNNPTKGATVTSTSSPNITSSPQQLVSKRYNGLGITNHSINTTVPMSMDSSAGNGYPDPEATPTATMASTSITSPRDIATASTRSPSISYSTTDDEDVLHMAIPIPSTSSSSPLRPERGSLSSGSDSYFLNLPPQPRTPSLTLPASSLSQRRRQTSGVQQRAKSPLALTPLAAAVSSLPPPDDWDYSETEWWGWVVLIVTWAVFVTGMGSCLGVWSWAWDVGTTPYAPPELEDDPTLPIVGYYPALIILTCVMAWVWVVVAWVGMKYFRHARVSGD